MVTGRSALPSADDPFGLFEPAGGSVSFAVGDAAPVERVFLPAQPDAARAELAIARQTLQRGDAQLNYTRRRLARLGERYQPGQSRVASFAVTDIPGPELGLLHTLEAVEIAAPDELAQLHRDQESDLNKWKAMVQEVQDKLAHPVQVKTQLGAVLVGYTWVDWSGDFTTIFETGAASADRALHHQAVDLVLAKLIARLRMVTVITTGAAQLVLKLSGPPGTQVLVIPAALKYVRDVFEVLRA
jgi:hypothetical protein